MQDFCPVMSMKLIKYGHELYNLTLGSNEALYPERIVLEHNNSIICSNSSHSVQWGEAQKYLRRGIQRKTFRLFVVTIGSDVTNEKQQYV